MVSQIITFTVLVLLVFGGVLGMIVRYIVNGNVDSRPEARIDMRRVEAVMKESNIKDTSKTETEATKEAKKVSVTHSIA